MRISHTFLSWSLVVSLIQGEIMKIIDGIALIDYRYMEAGKALSN